MVKIRYVTKRKGSGHFQYVRNVKDKHRHLFGGKKQVWRSLETDVEAIAIVRASRVSEWYERIVRQGGGERIRAKAGACQPPPDSRSPRGDRLGQLYVITCILILLVV